MKKLGLHILGAVLLSSIPMHTAFAIKKRKYYECYSDKKISQNYKNKSKALTVSEYTAVVREIDEKKAYFTAKRNFIANNKELRTETLSTGEAHVQHTGNYLTVQALEWALAIAPEKKRASLYSSNPDLNEIPMFCLSQQVN
ncbi:MAG: hypothetical protein V4596_00110 [Bdellovibrionota bacterium]